MCVTGLTLLCSCLLPKEYTSVSYWLKKKEKQMEQIDLSGPKDEPEVLGKNYTEADYGGI